MVSVDAHHAAFGSLPMPRLADSDTRRGRRTMRLQPGRDLAMIAPNQFWLHVHMLADAYEAEGASPDERVENVVQQFERMPPIAQRQVLADLLRLTIQIPDLYPSIVSAAKASDGVNRTSREDVA
jgi:hypothetical protein